MIGNLSLALILGIGGLGVGAASAEPVTVAALGDSLTAGYGLAPDAGFVPQLQRWLDAHGADIVVRNAGVSGDTTQGGLARVDWTLTDDVDAMIVALGGNDMLRGIDPALVRKNLSGILRAAQQKGVGILLAGMTAPGNYGPDYKREFDEIYVDLAQEFDVVYVERFLGAIGDALDNGRAFEELMQADGLHPNAAGIALMVEAIGPAVLTLVAPVK